MWIVRLALAALFLWLSASSLALALDERPSIYTLPPIAPPRLSFSSQAEWRGYTEARIALLKQWEEAWLREGRGDLHWLKRGLSFGAIATGSILMVVGVGRTNVNQFDVGSVGTLIGSGLVLVGTGIGCLIYLRRPALYREQIAALRYERSELQRQLGIELRRPMYSSSIERGPRRAKDWWSTHADLHVALQGAQLTLRF